MHKALTPFGSNLQLADGEIVTRMWVTGWTQRESPDRKAVESCVWWNTLCGCPNSRGRLENLPCSLSSPPWLPNTRACSRLWQALSVALCRKWQLLRNIRWKDKSWGFLSKSWARFESCALGMIKKENKRIEQIKAGRSQRHHVIWFLTLQPDWCP